MGGHGYDSRRLHRRRRRQLVSQGRTAIAHKGMLLAGKVLAATAIRLFSDHALLEASQRELWQALSEHPYRCPIPAEVRPSVLR